MSSIYSLYLVPLMNGTRQVDVKIVFLIIYTDILLNYFFQDIIIIEYSEIKANFDSSS